MKPFFFILFTITLHTTVFSQTDSSANNKTRPKRFALNYKNALKLDGRFFLGNFIVSYERFLNRSNSVNLVGRYYNNFFDNEPKTYATSIHVQYRHYFTKRDKRGYYIGASTGIGYYTNTRLYKGPDPNYYNQNYNENFRFTYIMLSTGYQLKIKNRLLVDLGTQINYNYWLEMKSPFTNEYETNPYSNNLKFWHYQPILILNLGYYF